MEIDKRKVFMTACPIKNSVTLLLNKKGHIKLELFIFIILLSIVLFAILISLKFPKDENNAFVVRQNNHLLVKSTNQRFRFLGGNHFNLLVKYLWGEFHGLTGEEVFKLSSEYNITVIRFWATCSNGYWSDQCLYFGPNNWKHSREQFLQKFDELVNDAEEYNIYLIPVLSDAYYTFKWMGSETKWNNTEICQVDSDVNLEYKEFVKDVVTRYKDRGIILAWEIGNEGQRHCSSYEDLLNWYDDTANYIRGLDPNHLISTGENNFGSLDKSKFKSVHLNENIGLTSVHIYDEDLYKMTDTKMADTASDQIEQFVSYWTAVSHDELIKPVYFGEIGSYDISTSSKFYDDILKAAYYSDTDGIIIWSWLEGGECDKPLTEGGSCITPTRAPIITEIISYWASRFNKT